jgi:hypothetical protein
MGAYSSKSDVKDGALQGLTQEADHAEAEREINRELRARGIDPDKVEDPEVLKELSVAYACAKRCLYATLEKDDMFDAKRGAYEKEYQRRLQQLTEAMVQAKPDPSGGLRVFGSVELQRG